jgi:hypothetical protein
MTNSKIQRIALAILAISASSGAALADENRAATAPATPVTAQPPAASSSPSSGRAPAPSSSSTLSLWSKRAAGVIAGIAVGIPVCVVRQPIHEEKYGVSQTAGKKARSRKTIPYALVYAPFAVVSGLIEAPFYALNNSLVNYDKPFSKEQFSITDRQEPLNVDPIKGTSER